MGLLTPSPLEDYLSHLHEHLNPSSRLLERTSAQQSVSKTKHCSMSNKVHVQEHSEHQFTQTKSKPKSTFRKLLFENNPSLLLSGTC